MIRITRNSEQLKQKHANFLNLRAKLFFNINLVFFEQGKAKSSKIWRQCCVALNAIENAYTYIWVLMSVVNNITLSKNTNIRLKL